MPNREAKDRKRKRIALNKKLAREGRTANQHKKWLEKKVKIINQLLVEDDKSKIYIKWSTNFKSL